MLLAITHIIIYACHTYTLDYFTLAGMIHKIIYVCLSHKFSFIHALKFFELSIPPLFINQTARSVGHFQHGDQDGGGEALQSGYKLLHSIPLPIITQVPQRWSVLLTLWQRWSTTTTDMQEGCNKTGKCCICRFSRHAHTHTDPSAPH